MPLSCLEAVCPAHTMVTARRHMHLARLACWYQPDACHSLIITMMTTIIINLADLVAIALKLLCSEGGNEQLHYDHYQSLFYA